ncbi:MAG TPA: YcgN family cysteine cluster protein [Gammaproteobacteria bacterium]|nr:YcgN family cysteine cluster protein [Gammaproteobacteria bacterium]
MSELPFWRKPLAALTPAEWEALCDGCGRCCLHKLTDEDSGEQVCTRVACRLLDVTTARCRDYAHRRERVPDCVALSPAAIDEAEGLPSTCAYFRRARGEELPVWHPLRSGRPDSVRAAGVSVAGRVISEEYVHPGEWMACLLDEE